MQEEKKRTLTLDFQAFGRRLLDLPEPTPEQVERARRAHGLLAALSGASTPAITAEYLIGLPAGAFQDAHDIVTGEATDAASRAVAESIDEDQWHKIRAGFEELVAVCDPTVGPEFI